MSTSPSANCSGNSTHAAPRACLTPATDAEVRARLARLAADHHEATGRCPYPRGVVVDVGCDADVLKYALRQTSVGQQSFTYRVNRTRLTAMNIFWLRSRSGDNAPTPASRPPESGHLAHVDVHIWS